MSSFDDFGLKEPVLEAIRKMGFVEPTPIQKKSLPLVLDGRDLLGQAQTGTGKTAAFGIPMAEKIPTDLPDPGALVLCPTRELAVQVAEEIHEICLFTGHKVLPIYGGQRIDRQLTALKKGVQVVVGTPGRILDHIGRGTLKLDGVGMLVLDEADMMLDMGFLPDIRRIIRKTPPERQTLLFSATIPLEIQRIARDYMRDPDFVTVVPETLTVEDTEQIFYEVPEEEKIDALMRLLDFEEEGGTAMIFCRTKRNVDKLTRKLKSRGYDVEGLHGDLTQQQRDRIMAGFREGRFAYLVATDVAARGLDISHVTHVINFHIPQDPEAYVHRIGRTGRMGRAGVAITFVTPAEYWDLLRIQEFSMAQIEPGELPSEEEVEERRRAARGDELAKRRVREVDLKLVAAETAGNGKGAGVQTPAAEADGVAAEVDSATEREEAAPKRGRRRRKEADAFEALPTTGVEPTTEAERHQRRHTLRDASKRIEWTEAEEAIKEASRIETEQLVEAIHEQAVEGTGASEAEALRESAEESSREQAIREADERRRRDVEERLREAERLAAEAPEEAPVGAEVEEPEGAPGEVLPFPSRLPGLEEGSAPVEVTAAAEAVTQEAPDEEKEVMSGAEAAPAERRRRRGGRRRGAPARAADETTEAAAGLYGGADELSELLSPDEEQRIRYALRLRDWALELVGRLSEAELADHLAIIDRVMIDHDLRTITAALLRELSSRGSVPAEPARTASVPSLGEEDAEAEGTPESAIAMTRLFISVGRRARVSKQELRSWILETAGIDEDDLGRVDLLHNFAFVEVRKAVVSQVIEAMHESVFRGREISVERAKSTGKEEQPEQG